MKTPRDHTESDQDLQCKTSYKLHSTYTVITLQAQGITPVKTDEITQNYSVSEQELHCETQESKACNYSASDQELHCKTSIKYIIHTM